MLAADFRLEETNMLSHNDIGVYPIVDASRPLCLQICYAVVIELCICVFQILERLVYVCSLDFSGEQRDFSKILSLGNIGKVIFNNVDFPVSLVERGSLGVV